jgi:hypothetical protein
LAIPELTDLPPLQPEFVIIDAHVSKLADHDVDERATRRDANHLVDQLATRMLDLTKFAVVTEEESGKIVESIHAFRRFHYIGKQFWPDPGFLLP